MTVAPRTVGAGSELLSFLLPGLSAPPSDVHVCKPSSSFKAQIDVTFSTKPLLPAAGRMTPLVALTASAWGCLAHSPAGLRAASESCHLPSGPSRLNKALLNEAITGRSDPSRQTATPPHKASDFTLPGPWPRGPPGQPGAPQSSAKGMSGLWGSWRLAQMNKFSATNPHRCAMGAKALCQHWEPQD